MIEDLPITDKLYFISVFVMQLPQLYSLVINKRNTLNIYSVLISICVWITFSIKAWRRTKLGWLYMLIGLSNLLISIILTYNIYTSKSIHGPYSIDTQYTYDMPLQMQVKLLRVLQERQQHLRTVSEESAEVFESHDLKLSRQG